MYNINTPTNTFRDSSYIITPEEEIYIQISVEFHDKKKYDAAISISWKMCSNTIAQWHHSPNLIHDGVFIE
jgi:hypothetical protein